MRIAIVGSRDFPHLDAVEQLVAQLPEDTEVVSGGARGVDQAAQAAAEARGLKFTLFKPDWSQGRAAGPIRNRKIVEYADAVVAFWDQKSKGTANAISIAEKLGVECRIFFPKKKKTAPEG